MGVIKKVHTFAKNVEKKMNVKELAKEKQRSAKGDKVKAEKKKGKDMKNKNLDDKMFQTEFSDRFQEQLKYYNAANSLN